MRQVADSALRQRLADTSAALVYAHRLRFQRGCPLREAPTLGQAKQLCPGERFAAQPSWALCSGTLIDRDLVLTAAHCLGADPGRAAERCGRIRIVFGYHAAVGDAAPDPDTDDVYACRRVAAYHRDPGDPDAADFAIVQLDRPVVGRAPAPVTRRPVEAGDTLTAAGYGAGLPLKIQTAAVLAAHGPGILTSTNSFGGDSGGGLYDAAGDLVALHLAGAFDWRFDRRCTRARIAPGREERAQAAAPAVAALCRVGWPSPELCGTRPSCGDEICSAGERRTCPRDCPPPRCGDRLCEVAERMTCADDCAPYPDVPPTWGDDPEIYRAAHAPAR